MFAPTKLSERRGAIPSISDAQPSLSLTGHAFSEPLSHVDAVKRELLCDSPNLNWARAQLNHLGRGRMPSLDLYGGSVQSIRLADELFVTRLEVDLREQSQRNPDQRDLTALNLLLSHVKKSLDEENTKSRFHNIQRVPELLSTTIRTAIVGFEAARLLNDAPQADTFLRLAGETIRFYSCDPAAFCARTPSTFQALVKFLRELPVPPPFKPFPASYEVSLEAIDNRSSLPDASLDQILKSCRCTTLMQLGALVGAPHGANLSIVIKSQNPADEDPPRKDALESYFEVHFRWGEPAGRDPTLFFGSYVTRYQYEGQISIHPEKHHGRAPYLKLELLELRDYTHKDSLGRQMPVSLKGQGLAAQSLAMMAMSAKQLEFGKLVAYVVDTFSPTDGVRGGKKKANGFYTFPRLGFDALLGDIVSSRNNGASKAPELSGLPDWYQTMAHEGGRLSDLLADPTRREWWKDNGWSCQTKFDLNPPRAPAPSPSTGGRDSSRSWEILTEYCLASLSCTPQEIYDGVFPPPTNDRASPGSDTIASGKLLA